MSRAPKRPKLEQPKSKDARISSGQYMKSSFDTDHEPIDAVCPSPIPSVDEPLISHPLPIDGDQNERRPVPNEQYVGIYALLRVINTTYRSNLTSPKWKNFTGSRIQCQDKIRLNNAIWRIWHQQFVKSQKIVACRFVSLVNEKTLTTQLTRQAKEQILRNLTGEYLKWRQNSKRALRKSLTNSSLTSNGTNTGPIINRRTSTPSSDPYSLIDGLDLEAHQLLFSTTNSWFDREMENPFSVQGTNPDLYQPIMGNCHFDFYPLDTDFFPTPTTDDFTLRYNPDPLPTDPSYLAPPPPPPPPPAPSTNILQPTIFSPVNYSTVQYNNYPSEAQYPMSYSQGAMKSSPSTLVNLLQTNSEKPTKRVTKKASTPRKKDPPVHHGTHSNSTMMNYPPTRKHRMSEDNSNSKHHETTYLPNEMTLDTSPSSTSSNGQNADSKRRQNIKNGFETLRTLIPELNEQSNAKISKAHMLEFTARHIESVMLERDQMKLALDQLSTERDQLHEKVSQCQSRLPNDGLPALPNARRSREASNALFRRYISSRTRENWLFYPYSLILRSVFEQFQNTVKCDSHEEFFRSLNEWKNKSLNLVHLRQAAYQSVLEMGSKTSFVQNPERVREECLRLSTLDPSVHNNQ